MPSDAPVNFLDWDSDFFSLRIGRIYEQKMTQQLLSSVDAWCCNNRIDCLYFLADSSDTASVTLAENAGFHLTDLRITLNIDLSPGSSPWLPEYPFVRLSKPEDIPFLRLMASVNHRDSRFYHDGGFSHTRCDELYATWIEKSCNGYAESVLVADKGDGAVGYISCHLREGGYGQIGLVGVSGHCQGEGIGKCLLQESLRWFATNGVKTVEVVTQGRNVGAQRLYQKNGFSTRAIQLWYHKWFR
jgi:ribosomal protein S18 acetylase RimI-like enzyme